MAHEPTLETFWAHPQLCFFLFSSSHSLGAFKQWSEDRQEQVCDMHVRVCDGEGQPSSM